MSIYDRDSYSIEGYFGFFRLLQCFLANDTCVDEEVQELKLKHPKVYHKVKMESLVEELSKERRDLAYEEALSVMKSFMKHRGGSHGVYVLYLGLFERKNY